MNFCILLMQTKMTLAFSLKNGLSPNRTAYPTWVR